MNWYLNHYHCEECNISWSDEWCSMSDDTCPNCGVSLTPVESEDLSIKVVN